MELNLLDTVEADFGLKVRDNLGEKIGQINAGDGLFVCNNSGIYESFGSFIEEILSVDVNDCFYGYLRYLKPLAGTNPDQGAMI